MTRAVQWLLILGLLLRLGDLASVAVPVVDVVSFVFFLVWLVRTRKEIVALYPGRDFVVGNVGIVVWWFVPFANLLMPLTALRELVQHAEAYRQKKESPAAPAWLTIWWVLFLGGGLLEELALATKDAVIKGIALVLAVAATLLWLKLVNALQTKRAA